MDIHSFNANKNLVLYSWSHSKSQTKKPELNLRNSNYWGNHGGEFYGEYVENSDFEIRRRIAKRIALAAIKANNYRYARKYIAKPSFDMYLMTGGSRDFMESRNIFENSSPKIHSFFMEASGDSFFPTIRERKLLIKEIISSLFEFCLAILKEESKSKYCCKVTN